MSGLTRLRITYPLDAGWAGLERSIVKSSPYRSAGPMDHRCRSGWRGVVVIAGPALADGYTNGAHCGGRHRRRRRCDWRICRGSYE